LIVSRPVPSCSMIITFPPLIPYAEKVWNDPQAASTRPYRNFLVLLQNIYGIFMTFHQGGAMLSSGQRETIWSCTSSWMGQEMLTLSPSTVRTSTLVDLHRCDRR